MTDQEQMASLFVSDEGELRLEPDWLAAVGEEDGQDWPAGWAPIVVPEAVAAGILRLIRERDEARRLLVRYGRHGIHCRYLTGPCTCGLDVALEAKEEPDGHGEPPGQ